MKGFTTRKEKKYIFLLIAVISSILAVVSGLIMRSWVMGLSMGVILVIASVITMKAIKPGRDDHRLLACGIIQMDQMSGDAFEEYLLLYFQSLGFKCELTRYAGDFGADLLISKEGCKIAVQAKRWSRVVGVGAVQEVVASLKHYSADAGMVVTTNYFSPNAKKLAVSNNITLWDRDYIVSNITKIPMLNWYTENSDVVNCPICGSKLIERKWERGNLICCRNYPKCKFIRNI